MLIAASIDGAGILEGNVFVDTNERLAVIFGHDEPDDLVGMSWKQLYPETERTRLKQVVSPESHAATGWRGEVLGRRTDGSTFPQELSVNRTDDGQLAWVVRDLSEGTDSNPISGSEDQQSTETPDLRSSNSGERRPLDKTTGHSYEEFDTVHLTEIGSADLHEYVPGLSETTTSDDQRGEVVHPTEDVEQTIRGIEEMAVGNPASEEMFCREIVQNTTERRERTRRLKGQHEVATLDRVNEVLLETIRELLRTSNRDVIERTVCDRLAESDLYQFIWIGERASDDRIVPRTAAGGDRGYLDALMADADQIGTGQGPANRAIRTSEVTVVDAESTHDPCGYPERKREVESIAAVPLYHRGTVYGVLMVHTTRKNAFGDRERTNFDVLGQTVGFIIHAVRSHKLLFADTVVELELHIADPDPVFTRISAEFATQLVLKGYVASGQQWVLYLEVDSAPPNDVVAIAAADPGVERARTISGNDDEGRIEVTLAEPSLIHTVTCVGASIRTLVADADGIRLVIEVPAGTDVREVVEHVRSEYPSSELASRHERDHEITTSGGPDGILSGLTDRQRESLKAAYQAEYFTWPRESTAEEVAESLDIAPATLHGHLRKAEKMILAELLEEGSTRNG